MVKENKKIKRVPGKYVVVKPYRDRYAEGNPQIEFLVKYYETTNGWQYGFSGDLTRLTEQYGLDKVLNECGFGVSLRCATDWVNNYSRPEELRIINTETGQMVNPLPEDVDLLHGKSKKVVQIDIFGEEHEWETEEKNE